MMYYVLRCLLPQNERGEALMEIHNCFEVDGVWGWRNGLKRKPHEGDVPTPIMIDFEPFRGYEGPPVELRDVCIPIMSKRLGEALVEVGVDNVEFFDAILVNTVTRERYHYWAFKVVGLVAAADLGQSDWESYDGKPIGDVSFEKLVIDESRIAGLLMFRLAENFSALMVHEKVREHVLSRGINTVEFVRPEDWVHL
jgi:hypothetical protein